MVVPNYKTKTLLPFRISILFVMKMNLTSTKVFFDLMKRNMPILGEEFRQHFSDLEDFQKYFRFVNNPFGTSVGDLLSLDKLLQKQFFDLVDLVNNWKCEKLISLEVLQWLLDWNGTNLPWYFEDGLESTNSISNNIRVWICIFGTTHH